MPVCEICRAHYKGEEGCPTCIRKGRLQKKRPSQPSKSSEFEGYQPVVPKKAVSSSKKGWLHNILNYPLLPRNTASAPKKRAPKKSWFSDFVDLFTKFSCPACKESSGVETDRTLLDSWDHAETIMQEDNHFDNKGRHTGSTRRPVRVLMRTTIFNQNYCCESCGHKWFTEKKHTFQP